MKMIEQETRDKLRVNIPKTGLKAHPTKTFLTVIDPYHVIERLNDVFGMSGWKYTIDERWKEGVFAIALVTLHIPEFDIHIQNFGGNDNKDFGDAYKGAVTDALTKCASFLEIGIEIYTGRADKPAGGSAKKDDDNRPWLKEDQFQGMLNYILEGKADVVAESMKKYRMKKAYREQLTKAMQ